MFRENPIKKKLKEGKRTLICWQYLCSPIAAEVVGLAGFDGILIDHEHGPGDLLNAISLMQAVSATPAAALVRLPWNDAVYMKRILDAGAEGVMVPSVNTKAEAEAVVAACRFAPEGVRGAGYPLVRASDYGLQAKRYPAEYKDNLLIICQVETVEAVKNVEEIAAVPGVDMVFIGPFDLSVSMNKMAQFEDPEFIATMRRAENAVKASGKFLGGLATAVDSPKAMFERGYNLVGSGADVWFVRDGALANIKASGRDD